MPPARRADGAGRSSGVGLLRGNGAASCGCTRSSRVYAAFHRLIRCFSPLRSMRQPNSFCWREVVCGRWRIESSSEEVERSRSLSGASGGAVGSRLLDHSRVCSFISAEGAWNYFLDEDLAPIAGSIQTALFLKQAEGPVQEGLYLRGRCRDKMHHAEHSEHLDEAYPEAVALFAGRCATRQVPHFSPKSRVAGAL